MPTIHPASSRTNVTVVYGDLYGWQARLVYRSTEPVQVTYSDDRRFAAVCGAGLSQVGAVVTPQGDEQPVIYLGVDIPDEPLSEEPGWEYSEMPSGVEADTTQVTVLALSKTGGVTTGCCRRIWADRTYRPMERPDLPVSEPRVAPQTVAARVLEAGNDPFDGHPYMTVRVDDPDILRENGWEPQDWLSLRAQQWADLDRLSRCIESESHPLLGSALLGHVIVHDLENLDVNSLPLLPADVRDGLERALMALPD